MALLFTGVCGAAACDLVTEPVPAPAFFEMVSAGGHHTCAIAEGDQVFCWGERRFQQIGPGEGSGCGEEWCVLPVAVPETRRATDLAAATAHTCVLSNSQAGCWGVNRDGELGDARQVVSTCPQIPYLRCTPEPSPIPLGFPLVAITGARFHSCALDSEGRAYCWGNNGNGRLGDGGLSEGSTPALVAAEEPLARLAAGNAHTCALTEAGTGLCWGDNSSGQLGTGAGSTNTPAPVSGSHVIEAIAAGGSHTCGVTSGGALLCWGHGADGRLGTGDTAQRSLPQGIPLPEPATDVTAGWAHTCAIGVSGALYCWGSNSRGQAGQPGGGVVLEPSAVAVPDPVRQVSAGEAHTCAVTTSDALYCWGANTSGQLGDGTRRNKSVPVRVGGGS